MRISIDTTFHVYLGTDSTAKRIEQIIYDELFEKCDDSCRATCRSIHKQSNSKETFFYRGANISVCYNRHELTLIISSIIAKRFNYPVYKTSEENTKHSFAQITAQRIAGIMYSKLSTGTKSETKPTISRGFLGMGQPGLSMSKSIEPCLPKDFEIEHQMPTQGYRFIKPSVSQKVVDKTTTLFAKAANIADSLADAFFS